MISGQLSKFRHSLAKSEMTLDSKINSLQSLKDWLSEFKNQMKVNITHIDLNKCSNWHLTTNHEVIKHDSGGFFQIKGIRHSIKTDEMIVEREQPLIIQDEIGWLGILAKEIDGILYFLLQAKIEPGNINFVQISPTLQATESNLKQLHKGKKTPFADIFLNLNGEILINQLQSEQASRFYKKRNRNIILLTNDDIPTPPTHRWFTLGQLRYFLKSDNIVNMDTRSVISALSSIDYTSIGLTQKQLLNQTDETLEWLNKCKKDNKCNRQIIPLSQMNSWTGLPHELSNPSYDYRFIFSNIYIQGREVSTWDQPLCQAIKKSIFSLFVKNTSKDIYCLVQAKYEPGNFDFFEIGPTIQEVKFKESCFGDILQNQLEQKCNPNIIYDQYLSEEGGRFYHDENRNIIIDAEHLNIPNHSPMHKWVQLSTLKYLLRYSNIINVQLRSLISALDSWSTL